MLSVGQAAMIAVAAGAAAIAAVCWFGALVFFVLMLRNMSGRRTIGYMLLHGLAAFAPENFNEAGQQLQRLFVRCIAGFFAGGAALAIAAAILAKW